MKLFLLPMIFVALASAQEWTGDLVDKPCFKDRDAAVNPRTFPVQRDIVSEVQSCRPKANKTTSFILVTTAGEALQLDGAGNRMASDVLSHARERGNVRVVVTGERSKGDLAVTNISAVR